MYINELACNFTIACASLSEYSSGDLWSRVRGSAGE